MEHRLYVGNLSFNTNEESLRDAFSRCGRVVDVTIITDRETGQSRGFGFVAMESADCATKALSQLGGSMLDGRELRVSVAEERTRRPGGPGGGGGGGGGGRFNRR